MRYRPDDLVSVRVARGLLGVSSRTLRRYTQEGRLPDRRSVGGHRLFRIAELERLRHSRSRAGLGGGSVVVYARVSTSEQRREGDLDRQLDRLKNAAGERPLVGVFTDVASGLSDRRPGLNRLLQRVERGDIEVVLIEHADRLARFGSAYIERLLSNCGCRLELVGVDDVLDDSRESELTRDLITVVASFAGRLYGARGNKTKRLRKLVADEIDEGAAPC